MNKGKKDNVVFNGQTPEVVKAFTDMRNAVYIDDENVGGLDNKTKELISVISSVFMRLAYVLRYDNAKRCGFL